MVLPRLTVLDGRYAIGRALDASEPLVINYQAWNLHTEDQVILEEFFPTSLVRRAAGSFEVEAVNDIWDELFHFGLEEYLKETDVLASIGHPNVMPVVEYFEANNTLYRILEHHKGATLASVLKKQNNKLPAKAAFTILIPLLDGLHAIHERDLIHGAFSPKAIFLAKGQGPMLLGFRTTHIMMAQRTGDRKLLIEDGISAPEQYKPEGQQGPWTDIYASAATLYRMLTGRMLPAASRRVEKDDVPDLLRQVDVFPGTVRSVVEQALSLDTSRRPRSAHDFQQQLLDALKKKDAPPAAVFAPPRAPEPKEEVEPALEVAFIEVPDVEEEAIVAAKGFEAVEAPIEDEVAFEVELDPPVAVEDEDPEPIEEEVFFEDEIAVPDPVAVFEEDILEKEEPGHHAEEALVTTGEAKADEAAQEMATIAARAQDKPTVPGAEKKPPAARDRADRKPQRTDRAAVRSHRRGGPVLAAVAVVMLIAFSGAYVLMQGGSSELGPFAQYKSQGDSLFAVANYIEAKSVYEQALLAAPNNEYVTSRLSETRQRLDEVRDERFEAFMVQGDSLYAAGRDALKEGDALDALSAFAESSTAYFEALRYRPNDPTALEKRALTSTATEEAMQLSRQAEESSASAVEAEAEAETDPEILSEQLYTSYRRQGDALLAREEYATARERFGRALQEKPGDAYAANKIQEIDVLVEQQAHEEQLQQALDLYNAGRYDEAKALYNAILERVPDEMRARDGLSRIENRMVQVERDAEYQQRRDQGDARARQSNYAGAIASYQQALAFKPGDAYVQQRIQAMQQAQRQVEQTSAPDPAPEEQLPDPTLRPADDGIYTVVDEAPELIGGLKELHRKVKYPIQAQRQKIEGRVYVQFVVTEEGLVENARVIRGIGGGCDEEAQRVVEDARFEPGKVDGQAVRVQHTLFITFKL